MGLVSANQPVTLAPEVAFLVDLTLIRPENIKGDSWLKVEKPQGISWIVG